MGACETRAPHESGGFFESAFASTFALMQLFFPPSPPPAPVCCCCFCCCGGLLFMRSLSSLILLSSSSQASLSLRFLASSLCPSASQCVISILLLCRNRLEASLFCSFFRSRATAAAAGEAVGPSGQV